YEKYQSKKRITDYLVKEKLNEIPELKIEEAKRLLERIAELEKIFKFAYYYREGPYWDANQEISQMFYEETADDEKSENRNDAILFYVRFLDWKNNKEVALDAI
ncbi:27175_t:CDS:2, partial [Gigaspora margarita]